LPQGLGLLFLSIPNYLPSRQGKSFDFYMLCSTPSNKIANRKPEQSEKGLPCLPSVALAKGGAQPNGLRAGFDTESILNSNLPILLLSCYPALLISFSPDILHPDFLVT